jgi:hypothetical protein
MDLLPRELIDPILSKVSRSDLKSLRRVSKRFSGPATHELFSHIHVTGEWASQDRYNAILSSPELSKYVTDIHFGADDGTYDLYLFERYHEKIHYQMLEADQRERIEALKGIIKTISDFPRFLNIHTIGLTFPPEVRARANSYLHRSQDPGTVEFQTGVLTTLFTSLLPIANLRSLALQNLQNINDESLTSSSGFHSVLGRLTELRLRIATEQPFSMLYTLPYLTTFFSQLPPTWLSHSPNLTSLSLSCDTYWGYIFGCDFRSLHLPNLKKLELGKYAISHDSQLNWIVSHGNTLEELVLKDVVILSYAYGLRYPTLESEHNEYALSNDTFDTTHAWLHPHSWEDYFLKFKDELPKLKHFELNSDLEGAGMVENRYTAFYSGNPDPFTSLGQFVDSAAGQDYGDIFEGVLFDWRIVHRGPDEKAYDEVCRFEML